MKSIHILVKGLVQGVWFRDTTTKKAVELKIKGTVQNLPNGDVEIYAQGEPKNIEQLVLWCQKGPSMAKVKNVITTKVPARDFKDFSAI
ncbi:MAG: acylphosphatase [Candidatus Bathyarchaeota archaeon]